MRQEVTHQFVATFKGEEKPPRVVSLTQRELEILQRLEKRDRGTVGELARRIFGGHNQHLDSKRKGVLLKDYIDALRKAVEGLEKKGLVTLRTFQHDPLHGGCGSMTRTVIDYNVQALRADENDMLAKDALCAVVRSIRK